MPRAGAYSRRPLLAQHAALAFGEPAPDAVDGALLHGPVAAGEDDGAPAADLHGGQGVGAVDAFVAAVLVREPQVGVVDEVAGTVAPGAGGAGQVGPGEDPGQRRGDVVAGVGGLVSGHDAACACRWASSCSPMCWV